MERINEHIDDAHFSLVAAAMLLEQEFSRSYCRDVSNGRIVALLDLHAQLQEVKRLSAAVRLLTSAEAMATATRQEWAVLANHRRAGGGMD